VPQELGLSVADQQEVALKLVDDVLSAYKVEEADTGNGDNIFAQNQLMSQEIEHLRQVNKRWKALAQRFMQETLDNEVEKDEMQF